MAYYKTLGVEKAASEEEIIIAFNKQMNLLNNAPEFIEEKRNALNVAFQTLANSDTRLAYDQKLKDRNEKIVKFLDAHSKCRSVLLKELEQLKVKYDELTMTEGDLNEYLREFSEDKYRLVRELNSLKEKYEQLLKERDQLKTDNVDYANRLIEKGSQLMEEKLKNRMLEKTLAGGKKLPEGFTMVVAPPQEECRVEEVQKENVRVESKEEVAKEDPKKEGEQEVAAEKTLVETVTSYFWN